MFGGKSIQKLQNLLTEQSPKEPITIFEEGDIVRVMKTGVNCGNIGKIEKLVTGYAGDNQSTMRARVAGYGIYRGSGRRYFFVEYVYAHELMAVGEGE
jgi:hypothetical protein